MDKNPDYTIIGIDGGGTHTRGILWREGKVITEAKSGTTRIGSVGVGEACERTLKVIFELCNKAETESSEIDAIVVGLAGVWLDEEKKRAQQLLRTLSRGNGSQINDLIVTSDAELALEGAFHGEPGIILIVGTGSIALGNVGKNKLVRCGGWGIELDDEGSGAWIGREGLTAVVRALDGRGKYTKLTDIIGDLYPTIDIKFPRTIVKAYAERSFEYHSLSPSVMKCAEEGDEVCLNIIQRSAVHLTELPEALQKQFKNHPVQIAMMGGIIDAKTLLASMLEKEIKKNKNLKLIKAKGSALDGAIILGNRMLEEMD